MERLWALLVLAQARAAQDQVRRQVDAAYRQAAEQRHAAEADGQ